MTAATINCAVCGRPVQRITLTETAIGREVVCDTVLEQIVTADGRIARGYLPHRRVCAGFKRAKQKDVS